MLMVKSLTVSVTTELIKNVGKTSLSLTVRMPLVNSEWDRAVEQWGQKMNEVRFDWKGKKKILVCQTKIRAKSKKQ